MRKGQAAMEFLMTYGWAILVVLIAIGALAYFGVLNPSRFVPNTCVLFPGLACVDAIVTENSITLVVINGFGKDITLTNMDIIDNVDGSNCPLNVNGIIVPDGATKFFSFGQCNNGPLGSRFRGTVALAYSDGSLIHTKQGSVVGQVEDVANVVCSGLPPLCTATPVFSYEEDNNPYWGPIILNTNDGNYVTMVDEGIVNPDYLVVGFPPLGIADAAPIVSSTLTFRHQENLPGLCNIPGGDTNRHKVSCYDGSSWQLLGTYAVSSGSFIDSNFNLGTCVSNGADANNVVVQVTFDPTDPGTGVCGTMDIDSATINIQT